MLQGCSRRFCPFLHQYKKVQGTKVDLDAKQKDAIKAFELKQKQEKKELELKQGEEKHKFVENLCSKKDQFKASIAEKKNQLISQNNTFTIKWN